jgi:alkanesulfonate monooxygenase SsuD/methylene tetrahydromethanopterin reductase-like flavin-dependent oxidoreductase (luciferase family)
MASTKIQFGWTMPPGARKTEDSSKFDEGIRHTLATLHGPFESAFMTDHLQWGEDECLEAWTTLAFYAALFPQYDWGTMVSCQSYRNPAYHAKMASTVQYLTRGRLIMGLGAGWKEDEYLAYNFPYGTAGSRLAQLEETVHILRSMWTQLRTTHTGKYYQVHEAYNLPQTPRPPILMIGGGGEKKTLPLAARFADWWNVTAYAEDYRRKVEVLRRECEAIGRDPGTLKHSWFGGIGIGRTREEAERHTRDDFTRNSGFHGTLDEVTAQVQSLVDAGCAYFMLDTRGIPEESEMQILIDLTKRFN